MLSRGAERRQPETDERDPGRGGGTLMRAGPSQEEVRRHNLGTLLRYVHIHGATSRAELTTKLGLNRSTIGALTTDLAAAGLVTERPPRETTRAGRPSLVVRPESSQVYAYAMAIE